VIAVCVDLLTFSLQMAGQKFNDQHPSRYHGSGTAVKGDKRGW
jgi:hypothetical protein